MNRVPHPSTFVDSNVLAKIRAHAEKADLDQQLTLEQIQIIYEHKWLKMFVPKSLGGLEYSLPEVVRTEEALAWADGSVGWIVTLCSGAGWFVGFLDPTFSQTFFQNDNVCLAGSGAPSGFAEITEHGFTIDGEWKYASGSLHATMFTANCILTKNGIPIIGDDSNPQIRAFILDKDEITIKKNWNAIGMKATASHGFVVNDVLVSKERAFIIEASHCKIPGAVFRYPFLQLAEVTLAANYSGMAQQFLDLCEPGFAERMKKEIQPPSDLIKLWEGASKNLTTVRSEFYHALDRSWGHCANEEFIPENILNEVSETSFQLYKTSLSLVDKLYPKAGLIAAAPDSEINRVWRNIHTASQHTLFSLR